VDTRRLQAAYNEGEREFTFAKTVVLRHKKNLEGEKHAAICTFVHVSYC